jgi:uncharacterized membrane protein YqjE
MNEPDTNPPNLISLIRKAALTGVAALQNRGELFIVELQEEKNRAIESLIWTAVAGFLGIMFVLVLTATIIWLFPEDLRIYAAGGFCLIYLVGAVLALLNLKALIKNSLPPFSDSISEISKDREWLESLK